VGTPQLNPQTIHKASDIGCGYVALDEHIKGDSKTYLILLNQVVSISVVNPRQRLAIATPLTGRGLCFLAKRKKINQ
jgi:hypothetical protein